MTFTLINKKTKQTFEKYFSNVKEGINFERKVHYGDKLYICGILFDSEEEQEEYDYYQGYR